MLKNFIQWRFYYEKFAWRFLSVKSLILKKALYVFWKNNLL
jgi:hypothetical protein